jgi:hypothetical protein
MIVSICASLTKVAKASAASVTVVQKMLSFLGSFSSTFMVGAA